MSANFQLLTFYLKSRIYLIALLGFSFLFSCGKKQEFSTEKTPISLSYAQGFEIFQGKDFWEIHVTQGYTGAEKTFRYLVLEENSEAEQTGFDAVVQLPISKVVLTSTTHIPHLDLLNSSEKLVGFPQTDLISSEKTRQLIDSGKVTDLGNGPSANPEIVIDLQPDWMMISTLGEDLKYLDLFAQAKIPAIINGEYVEQNPLGRAEWIKFTGILLGKYAEAKIAFEEIEKGISASVEQFGEIETTKKELAKVFEKMWANVTLSDAAEYFKTDVSDSFFTINADGIVQNKAEVLADSKRLEMLEILDFEFFDQQIKVFEKVGIINGRIKAFSEGAYVGEVFYTAIFVKYGTIWKYENWQGTWSKDSPPPPAFTEEK
jgi:hypothetical protein